MDRLEKIRSQLVVGFVDRQVELIEAVDKKIGQNLWKLVKNLNSPCVCRRESISRAVVAMNLEFLRSVHALEGTEALQRNFGRAGDELKELGSFGLVEAAQRSPEPLNLLKKDFFLEI